MRRSWRTLHLVALLSVSLLLLVGCGSNAKTRAALTGKPDQPTAPAAQSAAPAAQPAAPAAQPAAPAAQPPVVPPELPGNAADLASALLEKSPVKYRITTVGDTQGKAVAVYFDQALAQGGPLPADTMLLMVFTNANYDIRFAMGADFAAKQVTVAEVLELVRSNFLTNARKGDPAEGLAKLVRAVNQRVSR